MQIKLTFYTLLLLAVLLFPAAGHATLRWNDTTVVAGQSGAAVTFDYATRSGIGGAGFAVLWSESGLLVVPGSLRFQIYDRFTASFVDCDGAQVAVAPHTNGTCSQSGHYALWRTSIGSELASLTGFARARFDVRPSPSGGASATFGGGAYCEWGQSPAQNNCVSYTSSANTLLYGNPQYPITDSGHVSLLSAATSSAQSSAEWSVGAIDGYVGELVFFPVSISHNGAGEAPHAVFSGQFDAQRVKLVSATSNSWDEGVLAECVLSGNELKASLRLSARAQRNSMSHTVCLVAARIAGDESAAQEHARYSHRSCGEVAATWPCVRASGVSVRSRSIALFKHLEQTSAQSSARSGHQERIAVARGQLNSDAIGRALERRSMQTEPFPDLEVKVSGDRKRWLRVHNVSTSGGLSVFAADSEAQLTIHVDGGKVHGNLRLPHRAFQIIGEERGSLEIAEIFRGFNSPDFCGIDSPHHIHPKHQLPSVLARKKEWSQRKAGQDSVGLLVLYTSKALQANPAILDTIPLLIDQTNQSFRNSGAINVSVLSATASMEPFRDRRNGASR